MRFSVYIATSPTGKQYIGKTHNFPRRVGQHYTAARKGSPYAIHAAIRKYVVLKFEEFFVAFTEDAAFQVEQQLISILDTLSPAGYNMTYGGQNGRTGYKHANETKRKIALSLVGRKHSIQRRGNQSKAKKGKPIIAFQGKKRSSRAGFPKTPIICIETAVVYPSQWFVAVQLNQSPQNLSAHLKGRRKSFAGYTWRYANAK